MFGAEELNSARQRPTSSTRKPSRVRNEFETHNNPGKGSQFHRHKKKLEQRKCNSSGRRDQKSVRVICSTEGTPNSCDNALCLQESGREIQLLNTVNSAGAQHNNLETGVPEQKRKVLNIYGEQLTKLWRDVRLAWTSYTQL